MNRLALGTVQFGLPYGIANQEGQVTRVAAKAMLQLAAAKGIDMLDTAVGYGESESCLGDAGVQGFEIVTKLPPVPENCPDINRWAHDQVDGSMARLGVNALYGLLLHRPEQLLDSNGKALYRALQGLKETGRVQKAGISLYSPNALEALAARYRFDLVQSPFNLVDRRLHTTGWLRRLKDDDVEIHTRSAFLQGLLLMSRKDIPSKFSQWVGLWDRWHEWLALGHISALQACLNFPLSFPEIDRVVVGADSVNQLEQVLSAAQASVPMGFPDLHCEEENLINPARWPRL